ncbi:MAG TPA: SpvB/TcaC N-terminal domain-containing protein [Actinoplanes sp.]|nr:SpvB/TcaC N-terminal domain-containing protein [Actinoplanes sp.]
MADPRAAAEAASVPIAAPVSLEYNGGGEDGPFGLGWRLCLPEPSRATAHQVPGHSLPARISYPDQDDASVSMIMDFEYERSRDMPSGLRCRSVRVSRQDGAGAGPVAREYRFEYRSAPVSGALLTRVEVVPVDGAAALATCAREGRQWRISFGARTVRVRHSVGMFHLAVLLANANVEISAAELAAGVGRLRARTAMVAQPILDRSAIQRYRQRLAELRAEIDESGSGPERVDEARAERDWLIAELGAGTSLGGRTRSFSDSAERARIAVGKAIRRAISQIHDADELVGEHLRRSVNTGMRCAYLAILPAARLPVNPHQTR